MGVGFKSGIKDKDGPKGYVEEILWVVKKGLVWLWQTLHKRNYLKENASNCCNMGKINVEWHKKHKMPKNPSFEERAKWHLEHAKECSCRAISDKLKRELEAHWYKV